MEAVLYSNQQLLLVAILLATATDFVTAVCQNQTKCGSVIIPLPFAETEDCSLDASFIVNCNRSRSPPTPFLKANNLRVLNISLHGELYVSLPVASDCYKGSGISTTGSTVPITPFQLSKRNKLTAVGFDTAGVLIEDNGRYKTACVSIFTSDLITSGSCDGFGCCEAAIRQRVTSTFTYAASANVFNDSDSDECGYAFLVKDGAYNFSTADFKNLRGKTDFPVLLHWTVGNRTCREARKDPSTYACKSQNSNCTDSKELGNTNGGYLCNCSHGFHGNPYLPNGCLDVNECTESRKYCVDGANCYNLPGTYYCSCPRGYQGDGRINGTGCTPKSTSISKTNVILLIAFSASVSVLALLGGSLYVYWILKKRKLIKLKQKFFQRNGGLLLKQQIAGHKGSAEMTKLFTVEELKQATNNFDETKILGQGGQGTVYKGVLQDNRTVAIKMSKITDSTQIEHFINEVIVLSQINHRNVVKLLGCCLETKVPLLVYEFIDSGTLYEHLHDPSRFIKLSWKTRLGIATETAGALAYLHSAASAPIIHRDVKTTNILLDHNLTAKVSDFGASRIIPLDQNQLTTLVQGDSGYLDPEYFHTSQLTEKSDVYSFGVVLAELITGKKALSFDASEDDRNLAMYFVSVMKENRLLDIVESHLIDEEANVEQLMVVANIAKQCLRVKGEERPTMREVAMELEGLVVVEKHRWKSVDLSPEETQNLLQASVFGVEDGTSGSGLSSGINSLNQISMSFSGR